MCLRRFLDWRLRKSRLLNLFAPPMAASRCGPVVSQSSPQLESIANPTELLILYISLNIPEIAVESIAMTSSEAELDTLVARFFEAAVIPELWSGALQNISNVFGAEGAALISLSNSSPDLVCSEGVSELMARFMSFPSSYNERARRGLKQGPWDVQSEGSLFELRETDRLPLYGELLRPLGFQWFAGAALRISHNDKVLLSIERKTNQGMFEPAELAGLRRVLPNLRAAASLAVQLAASRHATALDAFNSMNVPAFLIDCRGVVLQANEKAQARTDSDLKITFGRLRGRDPDQTSAMADYVSAALQALETPRPGLALRRSGAPPILLHIRPLAGQAADIFAKARAIVTIADPTETRLPSAAELKSAFDLSVTEARVARAIAAGIDLARIASDHGTSIDTVRGQLKSVFNKTGVSRQAELASLLGRLGVLSR